MAIEVIDLVRVARGCDLVGRYIHDGGPCVEEDLVAKAGDMHCECVLGGTGSWVLASSLPQSMQFQLLWLLGRQAHE